VLTFEVRSKVWVRKSQIPKLKICKSKKDGVHKSQTCKVPNLRKVRKSNKLFRSADLRICSLRNLFADCPPLSIWHATNNVLDKIEQAPLSRTDIDILLSLVMRDWVFYTQTICIQKVVKKVLNTKNRESRKCESGGNRSFLLNCLVSKFGFSVLEQDHERSIWLFSESLQHFIKKQRINRGANNNLATPKISFKFTRCQIRWISTMTNNIIQMHVQLLKLILFRLARGTQQCVYSSSILLTLEIWSLSFHQQRFNTSKLKHFLFPNSFCT